jgi:hypothetical protein
MLFAKKTGLLRVGASGALALSLLIASPAVTNAQDYRSYSPRSDRAMSPVDVVSRHLEGLAHRTGSFTSRRERERFDNAIRHLSQFQNQYYRGHFDKGRLDQAINDVQNIVDHNPLDDRARGMLWQDVNDLRAFRATRGAPGGYGYR